MAKNCCRLERSMKEPAFGLVILLSPLPQVRAPGSQGVTNPTATGDNGNEGWCRMSSGKTFFLPTTGVTAHSILHNLLSNMILLQASPVQLRPVSFSEWPADLMWGRLHKQIHKHFTNIIKSNSKHGDKTVCITRDQPGFCILSQPNDFFSKPEWLWRETRFQRNEDIYCNIICKSKNWNELPGNGQVIKYIFLAIKKIRKNMHE